MEFALCFCFVLSVKALTLRHVEVHSWISLFPLPQLKTFVLWSFPMHGYKYVSVLSINLEAELDPGWMLDSPVLSHVSCLEEV